MENAPAPAARFDGMVCFSVYAAGLAFNRVYKRLLDRFGLTYPQYLVLVALRAADGPTVSELGDALFLDSNTVTPMLKRMEAAGLVSRQRDSTDQRIVKVTLTDKGALMAQDLACIPPEIDKASGMDAAALSGLEQALRTLTRQLRTAV